MNIINGLISGCCGNNNHRVGGVGSCCSRNRNPWDVLPSCACVSNVSNSNNRVCCNSCCGNGSVAGTSSGCCNDRVAGASRGCCGDRVAGVSHNNCCCGVTADIQIVCVDKNCNPVCNCVFQIAKADGCCKTIDLRNCNRSTPITLPEGCSEVTNTCVPDGFCPLDGNIFCEVGEDSCGRPTTIVSADCSLDDNLSVRRECGVTIITCKLDRVGGANCDNGCECSSL